MLDYALMNQCLYEGKAKEVEEMTRAALAEGRPVQEILSEGLIAGMSVVGEDFKYNILYVPEVLIAARAMKAGMGVLKPLLSAHDSVVRHTGTVLMGTVRGDLHDIGKNLVCMMAEGAGFKVVDIGVDQSLEKFLAATEQHKPDIIGMSALLTTTMTYMKTVVDGYKERGLPQKFAVGGAPISQGFAQEIGADGYGSDASNAVDLFLYLVGKGEAPKTKSKVESIEEVKAERESSRSAANGNSKSRIQILYWQDIPSQIKAWDDFDEVKVNLPEKFAIRIDAAAQRQGLVQEETYSAQLRWGEPTERPGSPREVADSLLRELTSDSRFDA
jgi:5-methyltetrahydrofolate--homocysteine methyltransferase